MSPCGRTRIEHLASSGHARARLLLGSLKRLDMYIAATQLGITMSSLGLGWVGEPALAGLIEPPLEHLAGDWAGTAASHTIAVTLTFILITALHIVFGELAPKDTGAGAGGADGALGGGAHGGCSPESSGPSSGR